MTTPKRSRKPSADRIANTALDLIENHVLECARFRSELAVRFDKGQEDRDLLRKDVNDIIKRGLLGIIGALTICLGYFLIRFGLPGAN